MQKHLKKLGNRLVAVLMMVLLCITCQVSPAQAATTTSKLPIICYTISTGRVTTYRSAGGSSYGYIDGSTDKVRILKIYSNGWCQVKYPITNGYKTAYTQSSNLFSNVDFSTTTTTIGTNKNVYRRSNLSQKLGTVYASDKVMIVGTSGNNTQIIYPISGGYKMGWISGIYSVTGEQDANIANGYYQIKSAANTDYVLDVYGASGDDGANIQVYKNQGSANQGFLIKKQSDGYYTVEALHSGKLMDVYNGDNYSGVNVIQWRSNGGDNQKWKIVKTSDGYYSFISKCNGLYLDMNGGVASNEVNIQCYKGNSGVAQKFVLQSVNYKGSAYQDNSTGSTSSSSKRTAVVNYMNSMATIAWTPQTSFRHWSYGQAGGNNMYWTAGTTYYGIPYTQIKRETNLESFRTNLSGSTYMGPAGQTTYLGNDCSSAVSLAYRTVNSSFPISTTYTLYPQGGTTEAVGNYSVGSVKNNYTICANNGKNTMMLSYASLQPGDLLLTSEHVMMVTETGDGYVKVTHQTTYSSSLHSTWRVNEKWTYTKLYDNRYIGVTMKSW